MPVLWRGYRFSPRRPGLFLRLLVFTLALALSVSWKGRITLLATWHTFAGNQIWCFSKLCRGVSFRRTADSHLCSMRATPFVEQDVDVALRALDLDPATSPGIGEIKRAFRRKVSELHPDRQAADATPANQELFMQVLDAYAVLTGRQGTSLSTVGTPWQRAPVRSREEKEADQAAYYRKPENWRWSQETGYNPNDLDDVWNEIGYNPYTGEYREPKAAAVEEQEWVQDVPEPSVTPQPGRPSWPPRATTVPKTRRQKTTRPTEPDGSLTLQILGYSLLVLLFATLALSPELLPFQSEEVQDERAERDALVMKLERQRVGRAQQTQWLQQQMQMPPVPVPEDEE